MVATVPLVSAQEGEKAKGSSLVVSTQSKNMWNHHLENTLPKYTWFLWNLRNPGDQSEVNMVNTWAFLLTM